MKNFLFVYRADYNAMPAASPEEMQATTQKWMDWVGGIAAQNKLAGRGSSLEATGKTLSGNQVVTDGPFTEIKEAIMGYSIVKVESYDEALELAEGCPILPFGSVEIREIREMYDN
jgi:hypothetical protein